MFTPARQRRIRREQSSRNRHTSRAVCGVTTATTTLYPGLGPGMGAGVLGDDRHLESQGVTHLNRGLVVEDGPSAIQGAPAVGRRGRFRHVRTS